ncbi:MAG: hypothetical protein ACTHLO_00185 [Pseudolabrys sp.]
MLRLALLLALAVAAMPGARAADALDELRATFTVGGKPVPPQVFGDFGDAIMSDNRPIIVSVDALTAIDSNRYADPIRTAGGWVEQTKQVDRSSTETTAYRYIGATGNGLLVAVAWWSGGGTGVFYTLHIVDAAWTGAFDEDGAPYRRLTLTNLRSFILGDRWDGNVTIAGDTISIDTAASRGGPGVGHITLQALRP